MEKDFLEIRGGDKYKAYVGLPERYSFMGASQFRLLTNLGLRDHHKVLDFGCGCLRVGKLLIPYLKTGNYYGQDPNQWLINEAIKNEIGDNIITIKKPKFSNKDDFEIEFEEKFDFIISQSVFSHTNYELTIKGLKSIYNALSENGIAVFTIKEGEDYKGDESWVYPGITMFSPKTIASFLNEITPFWKRLFWFNPAQTWYIMAKRKEQIPSLFDRLFLLGGEEIGSKYYRRQDFLSNRFFSIIKKYALLKKYSYFKDFSKKIFKDFWERPIKK